MLNFEPLNLLVIDELELDLHPAAWMRILSEWIKGVSESIRVVITTHGPDLSDHFTDRYQEVIRFDYDGKNHFTPERLPEDGLKDKFKEGWELGDLYRVGDHAIGGWPW